jgi:hypothetical protein
MGSVPYLRGLTDLDRPDRAGPDADLASGTDLLVERDPRLVEVDAVQRADADAGPAVDAQLTGRFDVEALFARQGAVLGADRFVSY